MKAIGYTTNGDPSVLTDVELENPVPGRRDLLVEVKAIAVNPVDTKVRRSTPAVGGQKKILGWDAVGIVKEVGADVTLFKVSDAVWYAGDLTRQGANAELHVVDERIVGRKPQSLSYSEAAALPLTTITAYELLFDRLHVAPSPSKPQHLLVVGAAGGVGSILVQLARRLTDLTVVGTASRDETKSWLQELGAHHVIDHSLPLSQELARIGIPTVDYAVSLTMTDSHFEEIVRCLRPQGKFGLIDDPASLNVKLLKQKSISLHWELMFTRSMFQTDDMIRQHELLNEVADLVDVGTIRTTLGSHFGTINAANLIRAHELLESGRAKGKIVLEGFS